MAVINKSIKGKCWEDVEKGDPSALLVGMQTGADTLKQREVSSKG